MLRAYIGIKHCRSEIFQRVSVRINSMLLLLRFMTRKVHCIWGLMLRMDPEFWFRLCLADSFFAKLVRVLRDLNVLDHQIASTGRLPLFTLVSENFLFCPIWTVKNRTFLYPGSNFATLKKKQCLLNVSIPRTKSIFKKSVAYFQVSEPRSMDWIWRNIRCIRK